MTSEPAPEMIQLFKLNHHPANELETPDLRADLAAVLAVARREHRAQIKEWSAIAYEMWALLCNSTHDGHGGPDAPEQWGNAFERLRARFHAALDTLPAPAAERSARLAAEPRDPDMDAMIAMQAWDAHERNESQEQP